MILLYFALVLFVTGIGTIALLNILSGKERESNKKINIK